jgi:hypothetical protein
MPTSAVGLFLLVIFVLPGSVFVWAYERQNSAFGATLADRSLRFIAVSVFFHLVLAWPEYGVYRAALRDAEFASGQFALLWLGVVLLVGLPAALGTALGGLYATRNSRAGWGRVRRFLSAEKEEQALSLLLGRTPAPRAWDHLFSERPNAYLRVRLDNEKWVAGRFANASYAGGFPHASDLFLEESWEIDPDTGELGDVGLGFPIYVPPDTIRWIEVIPEQSEDADGR